VYNKCDKSHLAPGLIQAKQGDQAIAISAQHGFGLEEFKQSLKDKMGYNPEIGGSFTARRRHIEALLQAQQSLSLGREQLLSAAAGELLAEDLRQAQEALSTITGEFTSDDLLGRIFSSFCIGK
jgi:tRNA modification GTPase